jgi:hypothetical protein
VTRRFERSLRHSFRCWRCVSERDGHRTRFREIDPDDETIAWGLCDLGTGFPEFGTVSLEELAAFRGRMGLDIERDLHFKARAPISVYIEAARKADRIVENVTVNEGGSMSTSFITPGHVRAFQAVTTQMYGEVSLASYLINSKPGVALVLVDYAGEGKIAVMPFFVAITDDTDIVFENVTGEGGGPKRGSCSR